MDNYAYNIKKCKLDNGLTLAVNQVDHSEAVCIAIFANTGSRVENQKNNGICHFIEHMVFKGTKTTKDIAEKVESKGGYINAWTSKEKTAWYVKLMKQDFELGLNILVDMLRNSVFDPEEIVKEKSVVVNEIKDSYDSPDDIVYDSFNKLCFRDQSLGLDIAGTEDSVNSFSRSDIVDHLNKYYVPNNLTLVVVGNLDYNYVLDRVNSLNMSDWVNSDTKTSYSGTKLFSGFSSKVKAGLAQSQVMIGYPAVNHSSHELFDYLIFSHILGHGMSSRLFKEIREKRGLAYHVHSYLNSYTDLGTLEINASFSSENFKEIINLVKEQIFNLSQKNNIMIEEIIKAQNQVIGSLYMNLERSYFRADRIGNNLINLNKIVTPSEIVKQIKLVNQQSIEKIANKIVTSEPSIAILSDKSLSL